MSVQLIVYPQSYEGEYSAITSSANDFIVDGINFNTINTSSSYDSSASNAILDSLTNAPPYIVNTWYRFRNTLTGTPTIPTKVSGKLTLFSVPTLTSSGVYQRLSNLVVGTTYEIVIDLSTTGTGFVITSAYNGTNMITQPLFGANQSQITHTWTAASTNDTIVITYFNTTTDFIAISNISVSEQGITPTTIYTDLQDGQVICDLYEDEDIPLSLSVDDFKNVAEKVQSYSKAFNLPATKRNNQIFDNIFEITRTDTGLNFNPYKRTKAILKQDGFLLFEGYLRMLDISDKSGEISYNVNLYSEVVALADVLGDKTFSDLDFRELEHAYQKTNIKNSWNDTAPQASITYTNPSTSGFRDTYLTVKYPFVDWTHEQLVGGSTGTNAASGFPEYTALGQIFRPFINIKYLIDRIFKVVPFTYESDFFNTDEFKKLYMDFNWGSNESSSEPSSTGFTFISPLLPSTTSFTNCQLNNPNTFSSDLGYDDVNHRFIAPNNNTQYNLQVDLKFQYVSGTVGSSYRIAHKNSSGTLLNEYQLLNGNANPSFGSIESYTVNQNVNLQQNDTLQVQWKTVTAGNYFQHPNTSNSIIATIGSGLVTTNTLLQNLRGELGQWNFLKGLLTMFNLVTLPDEDNPSNIRIEPYGDAFISSGDTANPNFFDDTSTELDWTDKIDVSEMKLVPLTDLNKKTIFKFVEYEDDYAFNVYKRDVNHLYGSKKYDASDFTILAGEDEIIAEPFAATVVKPLMSQYPDLITPALYSMDDDESTEGFENSPRIMFNNGVKSAAAGTFTSCTYFIPEENGVTSENLTSFLQFSHLTDVPTIPSTATVAGSSDFHFGECQLIEGVGSPVNNNLFNLYWLPYYSELYNPDTRIMTIKVNLSPSDINTFKFNDTVFIKNRTFRVNKIDYKPNDLATVEFILIP
jgi:hypothetical protein